MNKKVTVSANGKTTVQDVWMVSLVLGAEEYNASGQECALKSTTVWGGSEKWNKTIKFVCLFVWKRGSFSIQSSYMLCWENSQNVFLLDVNTWLGVLNKYYFSFHVKFSVYQLAVLLSYCFCQQWEFFCKNLPSAGIILTYSFSFLT